MIYPNLIDKVFDTNKNYYIVVSAGQSNTLNGAGFSTAYDLQIPGVWQLSRTPNNRVIIGNEPIHHYGTTPTNNPTNIGHIGKFSKLLKQNKGASAEVIMLGQGRSGTSFYANEWGVGNYLEVDLVGRLSFVLSALQSNVSEVIFLWQHGESDGGNNVTQQQYINYFDTQHAEWINTCNTYNVSVVKTLIGQMLPAWIDANPTTHPPIDNALQDTPNRIANCKFVSSRTPTVITDSNDGLHYNAAGQRILAQRYFDTYLTM